MDLIIFNPPRYQNGQHHKFNNALLWLASYLHQRGVQVRVVPLNDEGFEAQVRDEVAAYQPKFVAVSCKWWDTLYSSTHIASLVKQCDPQVVTIAGGHTATYFAAELVEHTDFDVVIRGDGEEPLFRLVTGQQPLNSVFKQPEQIPVRNPYVQTEADLKSIYLSDDLESILSDLSVVNGYVWTGKGCLETCVYCAANVWNGVRSFGRDSFIYRPIELVRQDIEVLASHGITRFIINFDPVRGHDRDNHHFELLEALPKKKFNCYFASWALPDPRVVDALAETFNFVELCIDVQAPSERLRKFLGDRRIIKPFFTDQALDDALAHCHQYDNFMVDLSALMGLPFEQDSDVQDIKTFSDYFYDRYPEVRYPYVSPMNVEPGSLILKNPEPYDMILFRKSFSDFMEYTKHSFENNINCYQPESYAEGLLHPLGAAPRADCERGEPFRVYETWKGVQENIDRRSQEKMLQRARKYRKFGLDRAGILGGIDRAGPIQGETE